jgi:hypothetical protein
LAVVVTLWIAELEIKAGYMARWNNELNEAEIVRDCLLVKPELKVFRVGKEKLDFR